jgi:Copine/C2 domain
MAYSPEGPKFQLFISCRKLKDVEYFSKSDPFVEIFERSNDTKWTMIGKTEVIWDNLNPDFMRNFVIDYQFEQQKYLKFQVFDANMEGKIEVKGLPLGETECTLGEIVGSKGQQLIKTLKLPNEPSTGNIILRVEQVNPSNSDYISIQFSGKNLENTSKWYFFYSYRPMFYISRVMENGPPQRIYSSKSSKGTYTTWELMKKPLQELCNGDFSRPIIFELYNSQDFIGKFEFNIKSIKDALNVEYPLINPRKISNKGYKDSGSVLLSNINIHKTYGFLDYIAGGCQINLMIAVDFTSSNGFPKSFNSLHYINPKGFNQYQSALYAVSEILLNYDSDKEVPMYGFGGMINSNVSHCFPLNFNPHNPSVTGLEGIMEAYAAALSMVDLSGPTLFAEVISKAVLTAEASNVNQDNQEYFILLILTDGAIDDMKETVDWIVRGSSSPISIVIVGIGNGCFGHMETLDADDKPLIDSRGNKMKRDIVQFVPYKDFNNCSYTLAKEVLAEIPREISNFFSMQGIVPNPRIQTFYKTPDYSQPSDPNIPYVPTENSGYYPYIAPKN